MTRTLSVCLVLGACVPDGPDRGRDTSPTSTTSTGPGESFTSSGLAWPVTADLVEHGQLTCSDPGLRDTMGLWDRTELPAQTETISLLYSGGMAIGDFDGDGLHDLFIPSETTFQLWLQQSDRSWLAADQLIPPITIDRAAGASAADYDGDGDLDLYISQDRRRDYLLRNDGVDGFTDVTSSAGLDTRIWRSMAASWADWDRDGDLDLSVATYSRTQPNAFWENQGDGTFVEVFLLDDTWLDGMTFQLTWHDLERDGYPDLFVLNDHVDNGSQTALFANRGGVLTVDAGSSYHPDWHGMGIVIADFDGDGNPDTAETSWKDVTVLLGIESEAADQGLLFVDASGPLGLNEARLDFDQRFAWGIDAGDIDHDRDLDLVATWGHWEAGDVANQRLEQPDSLWLNEGGVFVEQPGHDYGAGRAVLFVDIDGDGHLDRIKRTLKAPTTIDRSICGDKSWVVVDVRDHAESMNQHGIGVRIEVETASGTQLRWIEAGSRSMYSSGPPEVHVGLGDETIIERLDVYWPDGRRATFADVPAGQRLTVAMHPPQ